MNKKTIYIAGKMTGIKDFNFPRFAIKASELKAKEVNVVNPADIALKFVNGKMSLLKDESTINKIIKLELEALAMCDSIYLLKGWETSKGAKKELQLAILLDKEIICE